MCKCHIFVEEVRSRSRHILPGAAGAFALSRQKRSGSGSERDVKSSKISKREIKLAVHC